jgi:hypothetical protein
LILVLGFQVAGAAPDPDKQVPSPEWMQARVWKLMELQDFKLEGNLRTAKSLHPIILRTKGRQMVFEFLKSPLQVRITMEVGGTLVEKRASSKDKWQEVKGAARLEKILDSDAAYEDLGLDFLRWGDVRPLGEDSIKTLKAWAYEAKPSVPSTYSKAQYWISSEYLAVLRVDAFDAQGAAIKRVEVNGVQQVGKSYVIKEMQISTLVPGRDVSKSRTYIEIQKAEPGSGL